MIRLPILRSQRHRIHENSLAFRRHWERHGSCRPKLVATSVVERINWKSLHNLLENMLNLRGWFPYMLQLQSPTIMRMASTIQSLTSSNQVSTHWQMGYGDERRVRCNWLASYLLRFRWASGQEKGSAKSLGIQDQVRWSRQCAVLQGQASLCRKSPNGRYWEPGCVCTDCLLGQGQACPCHRRQAWSWDPSNRCMHGCHGRWLGGRDLYVSAAGLISYCPNWEPILRSKSKQFG